MLTPKQIDRIYLEGFDFHARSKSPHSNSADCDLESLEIIIYLDKIHSSRDLAINMFHECIHARDEIRNPGMIASLNKEEKRKYDLAVEEEAESTYKKTPWVMNFIEDYLDMRKEKRISKYL